MLQGLINWLAKFVNQYHGYNIEADYVHDRIHKEYHFNTGHLLESVANNGTLDIRISTGDNNLHVLSYPAASGKAYFDAYQGTTFSGNGTEVSIFNNKTDSTNNSTATAYHTPTITDIGTNIAPRMLIPGGTGGNSIGNAGAERNEHVLAPNSEYLFRITNKAGNAQDLNIILSFYEH